MASTVRARRATTDDADADARLATDALIEAALAVPLPPKRRSSSGLVEQQALFHRITARERALRGPAFYWTPRSVPCRSTHG
jgi:hypothetical protein